MKYRIVKRGGYENLYKVQRQFMRIFWFDQYGAIIPIDMQEAEAYIKRRILQYKNKLIHPKDVVVKEFTI